MKYYKSSYFCCERVFRCIQARTPLKSYHEPPAQFDSDRFHNISRVYQGYQKIDYTWQEILFLSIIILNVDNQMN